MNHGFPAPGPQIAQPNDGPTGFHEQRRIRIRLIQLMMRIFGNGNPQSLCFETFGKPGNQCGLPRIAESHNTYGLHDKNSW